MSKVADGPATERRKVDHIRINLEENVQFPHLTTGLEHYRFMHEALPELDVNEIDTSVELFGKSLKTPILISSMTGGTDTARQINRNLAEAAQEAGIAMGLGSQRAAIENPELAQTYDVRDVAPDVLRRGENALRPLPGRQIGAGVGPHAPAGRADQVVGLRNRIGQNARVAHPDRFQPEVGRRRGLRTDHHCKTELGPSDPAPSSRHRVHGPFSPVRHSGLPPRD